MEVHVVIGIALVAAGALDAAVALLVIGPRVPEGSQRTVVVGGMISGGALMAILGVAIALEVFKIG